MGEWKECRLGDVAELVKEKYTPQKGDALNYIGLEHIQEQTLRLLEIGNSDDISSAKFYFKSGDILFGKLRPYFRKVVRPNFDGVCSTDIWVIRSKNDVLQEYLFYLFACKELVDLSNSGEAGTRMPRADWKFLSQSVWNIPIYETEQRAIASILSSLDDKIDLLHRQNKTLEAMAETLFRQWFVEEADKREVRQISDLVEFNPVRTLSKGTIASYLEMANVNTDVFHPIEWYDREYNSGTKFINGDTLLARITPCLENGKSTYVTFLKEGQVGWGSTEFIVMRSENILHPLFSYILSKNTGFRDYAEGCLEGSSGRQRVNVDHLINFEIGIPDQSIIVLFNRILSGFEPKLQYNFKQIRTLEKLRDTLLPKLMSGEVRVEV